MLTGQRILFCFCYGPPNEDPSWIDVFVNFLYEVCDQFDNIVISGDFNLPDIFWDSTDSTSGINELVAFIETLHDHLRVFTDHNVIIFQFINAFIKAPPKTLRFVYD